MPLATLPLIDNYSTVLSQARNGAVGTIYVNTVPTFTFPAWVTTYIVVDPGKSNMQVAKISAYDATLKTITVSSVTVNKGNGVAYTAQSHSVGAKVRISDNYQFRADIKTNMDLKVTTNSANTDTGSFADATARDAYFTSPANGNSAYLIAEWYWTDYIAWARWQRANWASTSNASTTVAGKVEIATWAENTAGTATGGTWASLVATPAWMATVIQSWSYIYRGLSATGTDAYAVGAAPNMSVLTEGMKISFKADTANTWACTINVDSLWVKNIVSKDGNNLSDWVIIAGKIVDLYYDGTSFIFDSAYQVATDAQANTGTDTSRVITAAQAKTYYWSSKTATTTRNCNSTGTQTVTHSLGTIPKSIEISAYALETVGIHSHWYYDSSGTQRSAGWYYTWGAPTRFATTSAVYLFAGWYIWTIGNLTTTTFDIVRTGTGAAVTAQIVFIVRS